jgi:hypothetical protein
MCHGAYWVPQLGVKVAVDYKMKISRLTVDKLGVKLYDRASAVIAELISNAYDADATTVVIEAPMGQFLATNAGGKVKDKNLTIRIDDNGVGMTPVEMQDFYLIVGKERRVDPKRGDLSKKYKRAVTGRKGVGKLAPFGICKTIEIISAGGGTKVAGKDPKGKPAKGYKTSHIILAYDDIISDDDAEYKPKKGKRDDTVSPKAGTQVILTNFNYRRVPEMDDLARQIAQRFGLPSTNWSITLRDNTKTAGSKNYQKKVAAFDVKTMKNTRITFQGPKTTRRDSSAADDFSAIGPDGEPIDGLAPGFTHEGHFYPLKGWVGYSQTPYKDELMAGVRIYCRGKIAAQTTLFGNKAGFTGEHSVRSYLVGELSADWLDEQEDLIQTDRRDILWSDELATSFQQWGQKVIKLVGTQARDPMRKTVTERFFEVGDVENRIKKEFPGTALVGIRDQATEIARTMARSISPGDLDDEVVVEDLIGLALLLAPHITLDVKLREAANDAQTPLAVVSGILRTARLAELASFGRIAEDRLKVIAQLEELKNDTTTVESEFQNLIEAAPWLINPQWAPVAANQTLETVRREFEKFFEKNTKQKLSLATFSDGTKRPDFVLSSQDGVLQLIEIKRPHYSITNTEMDRIILYIDQMAAFLADPKNAEFGEMFNGFKITLVSDGESLKGAQKTSYDHYREKGVLEHLNWRSFLLRTHKTHQSFLKEAERQRTLAAKS